jgi:hypothetical protein
MYIPVFHSGLGNQLFQLFSTYCIAKKKNDEFKICEDLWFNNKHNKLMLNYYEIFSKAFETIEYEEIKDKPLNELKEKYDFLFDIDLYKTQRENINVVSGYLQNMMYLKGCEDEITALFYKMIQPNSKYCDYVCMHIRLGDNIPENKKHYIELTEYYLKALKENTNPTDKILIVSDEPDYVDVMYHKVINYLEENKYKYKILKEKNPFATLSYTSACKAVICANSTFSFWIAYPNHMYKKFIIHPDKLIATIPNSFPKIPKAIVINV